MFHTFTRCFVSLSRNDSSLYNVSHSFPLTQKSFCIITFILFLYSHLSQTWDCSAMPCEWWWEARSSGACSGNVGRTRWSRGWRDSEFWWGLSGMTAILITVSTEILFPVYHCLWIFKLSPHDNVRRIVCYLQMTCIQIWQL